MRSQRWDGSVAEAIADVWRHPGRSTRALIDLDAIESNVRVLRALTAPAVDVMAVAKANAYGHGAVPVARAALAGGATWLAVATVDEGAELRRAGVRAPILVLGPIDESEISQALQHELTLSVGDLPFAGAISAAVQQANPGNRALVHIKVDTGMRRFGAEPAAVLEIARFILSRPELVLDGVFTHFACADEPEAEPTQEQAERFRFVLDDLSAHGISPNRVHQANSAATIRFSALNASMVRVGIAMYGLDPSIDVPAPAANRPVMTIVSRVRRVIQLRPGDSVSYGGTYRATEHETAALIPIGYADGYRRALSNSGWMNIGGERWNVRGRVCMDQTVVGVPRIAQVDGGSPVVVAGGAPDDVTQSLGDLATLSNTINYEIATGIAARVPRFYLRSGRVVAIQDLFGLRDVPS